MKRILILIVLGLAIFEPQPIPEPIGIKPVLKGTEYTWVINGKIVARYQDVIMPNGSKIQLKAPDKNVSLAKAQWQAKADDVWQKELNKPEIKTCTHCGGTGIEP